MRKILVAGATGYLGQHMVRELKQRGYWVRVLIRNRLQREMFDEVDDCFVGQVTNQQSLQGVAKGIDCVFSSIGITRQKDGLTYMDVDYQGNVNLLEEAKRSEVTKFMYVSALNGDQYRNLKIFEAKERFVDELKTSGLDYTILRPNGFFSDMRDFLDMAKSGTVYLFGHGNFKLNPISGEDLATVCADQITLNNETVNVGGPDMLTQNAIAELALNAWNKKTKIIHLPDWIRRFVIWVLRTFTTSKVYGPFEFFLTVMATDQMAPTFGNRKLAEFYQQEVKNTQAHG